MKKEKTEKDLCYAGNALNQQSIEGPSFTFRLTLIVCIVIAFVPWMVGCWTIVGHLLKLFGD
jgi:hypothetical protein